MRGRSKKKITTEQWLVLISEKLKELRREDSTSYENFALEHGLDRKQYWRIENGANITVRTLIKTLEIHDVDIVTFFREIEMPKKVLSKL
jgi:transcriptional regulator with XRE-family HTH domain